MASYVTKPRKKSATRDSLSKTVHAISYATAVPVTGQSRNSYTGQSRNSYTLPSSPKPRQSVSGGSYVSQNEIASRRNSGGSYVSEDEIAARRNSGGFVSPKVVIAARRDSKEQYGISQSMHVRSIDYDPYKKYKNPAANGGANPQISPLNTTPGYGVPKIVGPLSRVLSTNSIHSIDELAEGPPLAPNLGMERIVSAMSSRRVSAMSSATFDWGPTNGLVSVGDPVKCHKVDYEIKGHGMQMVEIELDPDETCIAEAGAMMFMDDYIFFDTKLGCGSEPKKGFFKKLVAAGGRIRAGESLFLTHFTNKGLEKARVAFGAPFPGVVVPINLAEMPSEQITCQRDAFLCAAYGTKVTCSFNKRVGSGFFGGEGFVLQKLEGDGMAFLHASGHIIKKELNRGRIRMDTGCLVAFSSGIDFEIEAVKGLKSMYFSGDGCVLAILKGTGTIWMQSLPFSRIADRIQRNASHFRSDESG